MSRRAEGQMRRLAGKRYWREADARVVVAAWQRSGETASGFARRHELDPRRLSRWRSRLEAAAPEAVRFHTVRVSGSGSVDGRDAGTIEIEFCG